MITIADLHYRALTIDNLRILPGVTTIIGANGSGKTTFLKLCSGITLPETGTILISGISPRESEIGWVNEFPDRNILFEKVLDEIASPLRFRRIPVPEIESQVRACAESVGIAHLLDRSMRELSGGEKVLVSLAAALVHNPKILILDECDSHLDTARSEMMAEVIRTLKTEYVIRCTQNTDSAIQSDHVLFFENSRILHSGTPEHVFSALKNSPFSPFYPMQWRICL
jgi:energy-coupling factor transport system ATP-binding protein